jgi:hypothetical protein
MQNRSHTGERKKPNPVEEHSAGFPSSAIPPAEPDRTANQRPPPIPTPFAVYICLYTLPSARIGLLASNIQFFYITCNKSCEIQQDRKVSAVEGEFSCVGIFAKGSGLSLITLLVSAPNSGAPFSNGPSTYEPK